jgi:hypothetical protein
VVAPAGGPGQALHLYLVNPDTGEAAACPAGDPNERHLWPNWTADGRIVYVLSRGGASWLAQWAPPASPPRTLWTIDVPASLMGAYRSFSGLGPPLSADGRRLAYYDPALDRIVLINMSDGQRTQLKESTRSGCWLDARRFVAATDNEMFLFAPGAKSSLLMRGPWLPRRSPDGTNDLILCTRGSHPGAFSLVRMKVISAD